MNRALKWKLIAGFVLVFLAGGMTGAFIVASQTHHLFFGAYHGAGGVSMKLLRKRTAKSRPISRLSNARNYTQSRSVIGAGFIPCMGRARRHRPKRLLRRSNVAVAAGR